MHSKLSFLGTSILLGLVAGGSAQAALYEFDRGPYSQENAGFPGWYQDTHGRVLELCLSKAVSTQVPALPDGTPGYMCLMEVEEGVYDGGELAFPENFPSEAFWFLADSAIDDPASGISLTYGAQLEAAFAVEEPAAGDQISFARIRVRIDLTEPGTYTVTHPYGVEVFNVTAEQIADAGGDRVINMTRDLGIGQAGVDFSGALNGDVGPFLRSVNGPYQIGNENFIGDPNLEEEVTGSPYGTNYVRLQGPGGIDLRSNLFSVMGKLSDQVLPTPVVVERATYSRQQTETGEVQAQQDVFAVAPPPPATATLIDTAGSEVAMQESTRTGNWYGQSGNAPSSSGQVSVAVDNSVAIPSSIDSTVPAALVDQVDIRRAEYRLGSAQLTVEAASSDETGSITLRATGIGDLAGSGALKTLTTGITPLPPARITVTSSAGGSDTEEVIILP